MSENARINPETAGPWAEISLDAICDNYSTLAEASASAETAAVVKCDAYGTGLARVAEAIAKETPCRTFFVAYPEEGAALRTALNPIKPGAEIYVFNGPLPQTMQLFEDAQLIPVINSIDQAGRWASRKPGAPCALHIDTGMNRLGAPVSAIEQITALTDLNVSLVMSHLACSSTPDDPKNIVQKDLFSSAAKAFPDARRSLAASGGGFMDACYHFDMTRIGVALYGASPFEVDEPRLKPVVFLKAPIIQIRELAAGDTVGYNATFVASKPTRIAVAALGYGDGFPTSGSNRAEAEIHGARAPVAGRISMDLICLDVTSVNQSVEVGDVAEFFGREISIFEAAKACRCIPYELLTGLGGRVDRRYV